MRDVGQEVVLSPVQVLECPHGAGELVRPALDLGLEGYDPERTHGHRLSLAAVEEQLARLAALPLAERRRVPGLEPERAPVIVAGAAILREILRTYGLAEIEVSERDILDGAALAAAELPEPEEGAAPPGAYTCC